MSTEAYAGVWRPGSGEQRFNRPLPLDEFKAVDKTYFDKGLRLVDLEIADGKYTGVWRPGSGAQWWWQGLCLDDFKTEDKLYFNQGLRLVTLEFHSNPKGIYKLPFDDDPAWKLANGNWDDPKAGHGTDPNGAQAFSFDFKHDFNNDNIGEEGQNVRAARSGIVVFAIDSLSCNTWNLKPEDPCYGARGEGNLVVIQHADGTATTYAHLKQNKVFVKKDDSVKVGQVIALSGNTGNSSTPHLHFDVHPSFTDWDHWTNTIRILFQDKNHACWIPRVGDALASNNS